MSGELEKIIIETLHEVAKKAVQGVLRGDSWGASSDVKEIVKKEAERLTREDEEIRALIRESLKQAIK